MFRDIDLRTTVGVGIIASLLLVFVIGFVARSQRDVYLVLGGYVLGMLAVLLNDRMKAHRRRV